MLKSRGLWIFAFGGFLLTAGCATGRNYQADLDALNARISALQGQISSKDEELTRLRTEASQSESSQSAALEKAESENRSLTQRLSDALAKLDAERTAKKERKKLEESDLK